MQLSIGRFLAATGVILLAIVAAALAALPALPKFKVPAVTPVGSLVIVVIAALWIVGLTLINTRNRLALLLAIVVTLAAIVIWNKELLKAISDAREWLSHVELTIFLSPGLYVAAFIAAGAAALVWLIFSGIRRVPR